MHSLIKQPACFKNPENPSCTDLIFTKKPRFLQIKCVIETGLSDFHRMTISDDMHFRKLLLKSLITGIFKKLTMKGSWSPHSILSLKSRLTTAKTLKKKYIRENNKPFMTKAYSKAIMQRTRFRNKFLKNPTDLNKVLYNKQRNYCVSLLRKEKKEYFAKLNEKKNNR